MKIDRGCESLGTKQNRLLTPPFQPFLRNKFKSDFMERTFAANAERRFQYRDNKFGQTF